MQIPDPSSSGWADKVLWIFGGTGLLAGFVSVLNWISNRNKPRSEIAKNDADALLTQADANVKLSAQLIVLHDKLNLVEASIDRNSREYLETIKQYRAEIEAVKAERDLLQLQLDRSIQIGKPEGD